MECQLELASLKRDWIEQSKTRVIALGKVKSPFTSDDVHEVVTTPEHPNHVGCLLAALAAEGKIVECGRTTSKRPAANCRKVNQYKLV